MKADQDSCRARVKERSYCIDVTNLWLSIRGFVNGSWSWIELGSGSMNEKYSQRPGSCPATFAQGSLTRREMLVNSVCHDISCSHESMTAPHSQLDPIWVAGHVQALQILHPISLLHLTFLDHWLPRLSSFQFLHRHHLVYQRQKYYFGTESEIDRMAKAPHIFKSHTCSSAITQS